MLLWNYGKRLLSTYLLVSIGLAGCASHTHIPYSPQHHPSTYTVGHHQNVFAYTQTQVKIKNRVLEEEETENYRVRYLRFPSAGINGQPDNLITGRYYQSKLAGKKAVVIVLPIWGVHDYPSRKISAHILQQSAGRINVFMMETDNYLLNWKAMKTATTEVAFKAKMREAAERLRTAGIDTRRFIDWAHQQENVDPDRISLIGFSIGSMVASSLLPHEPRIRSAVLVMGGANPQEIFSACPWRPGDVRELAMERFGWSQQEYRALMSQTFAHLDPARYPARVDPSRIIIFDAQFDECIPDSARNALWRAMGYPERVTFNYKHEASFLAMTPLGGNFMRKAIYAFLVNSLGYATTRPVERSMSDTKNLLQQPVVSKKARHENE